MIRHTTSFLFSFIIHSLLFLFFFYSVKFFVSDEKKVVIEDKHFISLSQFDIQIQKDVVKSESKEEKPKEIEQKQSEDVIKTVLKKERIKKVVETIKPQKKDEKPQKIEKLKVISNIEKNENEIEKKSLKDIENIVQNTQNDSIKELEEEQNEIAKKIRDILIANKYYPRQARRRGIEGVVFVEFLLTKDGYAKDVKTVSKHNILADSLKETIINISGDFPKAKRDFLIQVPIKFTLKR